MIKSCCWDSRKFSSFTRIATHLFAVKQSTLQSLSRNPFPNVTLISSYSSSSKDRLSSLIRPIEVKPVKNPDEINVGVELSGSVAKEDVLRVLNQFLRRGEVKELSAEAGLDSRLFHQAYISFRRFCLESDKLPVDLHVVFSDVIRGGGHVDDIFPFFLRHAKQIFPHLDCMDDLKKISDLRSPANWYPEARGMQRRIIFHSGPTNSGKTYHALDRYFNAKSGIYCGPLRLLATEIFHKASDKNVPCDLITGEERIFAISPREPANHSACTVEMCSVSTPCEIAILDEIQMIRDPQRGWAWTRALLGLCAEEIHLCGEVAAIDLVKEFTSMTGDSFEVRSYKRLTPLVFLDKALDTFDNTKPGDCIVCFSKNDIFYASRELEKRNKEIAVIYGALPPATKLAEAKRFNDPNDPCKIMIATDAIGMGINLCINRIIFFSLMKPTINTKGEKEMDLISTSQGLQIAGRAGRFGTPFDCGYVTTLRKEDLPLLHDIVNKPVEPITQAGLHPTAEQIELFAYHLPKASLANLIDIFVTLSELDSDKFFMCSVDDFKFLADMIEHVPIPLRVRYVFCCAPISKKHPFVCTMFLKFARQFSRGVPLTLDWLCHQIGWPLETPKTVVDLVHLEGVFDVLDLYLWLSYRFQDMFPDVEHIRDMQKELDEVIQYGVRNIVKLLLATETQTSTGFPGLPDDENLSAKSKSAKAMAQRRFDEGDLDEVSQPQTTDDVKKLVSVREEFLRSKNMQGSSPSINVGSGRLTDQLIKKGVLTEEVLKKLQEEWKGDSGSSKRKPVPRTSFQTRRRSK